MKLLVLDFTHIHTDLKPVLKSRGYECIWLNAVDIDSLCQRLRQYTVEVIVMLDHQKKLHQPFVSRLQQQSASRIVYKSEAHLDVHALIQDIETEFDNVAHDLRETVQKPLSEDIDPRFFKSIDLFHVIDRLFSFFSRHILCEDVHWIAKHELKHFLTGDLNELKLELEVDYKRSHRLKSLNEKDPIEVVKWLRELAFSKVNLDHVAVLADSTERHLWLPLYDQGKPLGTILLKGVEVVDIEKQLESIEEPLKMISRFLSFALQMWEAQSLTVIDDLTELHNQRYLPRVLDREIARANRIDKKFTVLFIDVDFFKKVNDSNGHWVGSHLLVELAKIFKHSIRSCDYAFRYGGDEFVLILVDSDAKGSEIVAERLRKKIESTDFHVEGQNLKLTVSIGLACYPDHARTCQDIIELADQAMYYGKNKSRNIVHIAS